MKEAPGVYSFTFLKISCAMKFIRMFTITVLCIATTCIQGIAHERPVSINDKLKSKIVKMIDHPDLSKLDGRKFHAEIEFIITPQNEVLVVAVYTNQLFLDRYVKEQLNYQALHLKGVHKLKPYRLNVTFVKP